MATDWVWFHFDSPDHKSPLLSSSDRTPPFTLTFSRSLSPPFSPPFSHPALRDNPKASERQENDALVDRTRHSASAGVAVDAELGAFRPSGTHAARVYALAGTPYRTRNRFYAIAACFIDVVP